MSGLIVSKVPSLAERPWLKYLVDMEAVTVHVAKTHLSQLLSRVERGEEIIVARGKRPVARLVPYHPPAARRQFGALRGIVSVGPEFFEPLPEDELARWEGQA